MSGDYNMNQTDSGWRKRQIALDIKAENARELGLDYEPDKTIMQMARQAGIIHPENVSATLEAFAALVRANERDKWMERTAILIRGEREACAVICDEHADDPVYCGEAIRARGGQA
jgi:hypothetical protein